ncbi:sodium:solute symporter family protein [Geosporobacter ferrireducens]|uniref:Sodium:solute symporter n=1 Tax=Geosporobacter ferrireducens TaxID=1424294 RepID=A0A1D8GNX2_9FIRM|nr:sodium:solute symporter family protein [Geosporobacter ferrireducens]AOT72646.1 sodium:solute symporter [Geosporobacter ferrireducens]MTI55050.1 sodium:solute symporter family protein [Geosporobacter ferrireducens]
MSLGASLWMITILMCGAFLYISWKFKDAAQSSFSNYAIGGKSFPMYLIFFTQFATIMGVGNFVGHAGSGYKVGLPWMAFILGEQGSKIIFALFFAGLAGKFTYNTFPEMIDDLIARDRVTRALAGLLASMIMIAWVGGQGKAFGNIFNIVTGADPIPIILMFTAVFILYTTLGGIYSVVWTDLLQGILVVIFGTTFYIYAFSPVNWSMAELGTRLAEVGKAELWTFGNTNNIELLTKFVTGCVGILVAQIYWQRCFSAKDSKTARNGLLYSGIIAIIMVMLTALVGMVILTMNQGLNPDDAMPWFMMNYVPVGISAMIFALILAAGMSSADSNLNSASILVVNDLIKPFKEDTTDADLVKYAKVLTIVIGLFAGLAAIYASSILGLFSKAYAMAGGGLVPLLLVGLLWKERANEEFEMGKKNSKVTPWGARVGIVTGSILTQIPALGPNRVLVALVISAVLILLVSSMTKGSSEEKQTI